MDSRIFADPDPVSQNIALIKASIYLETCRQEDPQLVRWGTLVWPDLASLNYMTGGRSTHRPETGTVGQPYPGALIHCQAGVS